MFAKQIDYIEAATPKTFFRYTGYPCGTSFGTKFEGLEISMGFSEEIQGLYHAGSVGIIMPGWLGALN
jgi:phytoene dehydrogenase-like protein